MATLSHELNGHQCQLIMQDKIDCQSYRKGRMFVENTNSEQAAFQLVQNPRGKGRMFVENANSR